ncbi:hypothetical protein GUITHDRAFT_78856 [Guillardia theta CCMP2712]|uniref:dolichyl-diphosphooligosaccharide--protein glycotransferase n=1 Tax=Guillardia theta (strain CCMP2712) TaxID=905079 RepID=L1IKP6_GUITC|nr:hypothetical protein GUITHDRAFT_78856 [Guillardia theta CCMP2712]EKX36499.1 hypothetical protein GUITHDRAFT_78856 [Guillardia theta CCMP2712]|mmetsp:Transcript_39967/g.125546  ORF Transcript_39967/g.125546 Transcript_39967/m.125546 type:complete len:765 (-) Transcript_39967:42-2336(-)|eukprot:XP_005823479.1 hypothetical protein GUITHDRAFT_78856 [Guillardia theta CCMP2712]
MIASAASWFLKLNALLFILYISYTIRLHAVQVYGKVIHEFDPWFNYRATDYLVNEINARGFWEGSRSFFNWYDDKVWYPLGRPVGTTIYCGLQFTSAFIYFVLEAIGQPMSLNDVCVYVPSWFASFSCLFVFGMAWEVSRSYNSALAAAFFMAISPAHLMRSVAGGYDNEGIAVAAICGTFYFWVRSLRDSSSWWYGVVTGLMYIYMVAAWGGYIFVLNMIGVHAAVLIMSGRYSQNLWKSYSIFYVMGTLGAIQFPVVGYAPLKSLEQLGPLFVFFWLQLMEVCKRYERAHPDMGERRIRDYYMLVFGGAMVAGLVGIMIFMPRGYLGPISARVRGLFVQHTRTGNPLVDSVAEHQATRDEMYYQYFHIVCYLAPIGFVSMFFNLTDQKLFVITYTAISMYFSRKMIRLILILAPASSVVAGVALELVITWSISQHLEDLEEPADPVTAKSAAAKNVKKAQGKKGKKGGELTSHPFFQELNEIYSENLMLRKVLAGVWLFMTLSGLLYYWVHCHRMAENLSSPSIMLMARSKTGEPVIIDDFRESYWWLRDNTPQDSRVLSWWDYGYQINGIANRTTIADGNTWNHEHIALLGRALVSPVKKAHRIVRHLADYVLVWSTRYGNMWGDDIAKSPHMARIGGSVYKDIKPEDFWQDQSGKPSDMMRKSLIYRTVNFRLDPSIPQFPPDTFEEVFTSKNNMVRIYKVLRVSAKSKAYCSEGRGYKAWYSGKPLLEAYPPGLKKILSQKQDFKQLEDFNRRDEVEED